MIKEIIFHVHIKFYIIIMNLKTLAVYKVAHANLLQNKTANYIL